MNFKKNLAMASMFDVTPPEFKNNKHSQLILYLILNLSPKFF